MEHRGRSLEMKTIRKCTAEELGGTPGSCLCCQEDERKWNRDEGGGEVVRGKAFR